MYLRIKNKVLYVVISIMESDYTGVGAKPDATIQIENLDLFEKLIESEDQILEHHIDIIQPNSSLTNEPLTYDIKNVSQHYLDLSATRLIGKFKVTKADGSRIGDSDRVAFLSNGAHALWDRVEISCNGQIVTDFTTTRYWFKAYMETLLSYNSNANNHLGPLSLWYPDDVGAYNTTVLADVAAAGTVVAQKANKGFVLRHSMIKDKQEVPFIIPLFNDVMQSSKVWPSSTNLQVRLYRTQPEFFLMSNTTAERYNVELTECKLEISKLTMHPTLLRRNEARVHATNFHFPIEKIRITEHTLKRDQPIVEIDAFTGVIPKYMLGVFIKSTALAGSYSENPYDWKDLGLQESYARINGKTIGTNPLVTDIENNVYLEAYRKIFDTTNIKRSNSQNFVSPELFKKNAFIQIYDFTPCGCFASHNHEAQEGNIRLHYRFKNTGLTESYILLLYMCWNDFYELDPDRRVILSSGRPL